MAGNYILSLIKSFDNCLCYTGYGAMAEDASRVRKNSSILARIRGFAANLPRADKLTNLTDARARNALGGLDCLAKYNFM